ncbi:N-formylglutamate deformylase [Stakelama saccharophila]|uniref:N-formylglutamate deformylase n=1 Tax=Stakelama saccharophila TaxID=3075605 RepID=A0ABZ0BAV9_9SPHN|nr:N-formylglutamate deformylase [Stakelama sp. W311]WNO54205.1 N-formylglutamate deformylase [Stakelama sp. W311]
MTDWLEIHRGDAPLVVAFPHTGTDIPHAIEQRMISPWRSRLDADWWIDRLYAFVPDKGATTVRTTVSRSVIDVNRDPSGASLYPGQATTGLCPVTTFDGAPLYEEGREPDAGEIAERRATWFDPYHHAIQTELDRLRGGHGRVVLYDAHSIRSRVPRLFDGELPQFNIGTDGGRTCAVELREAVTRIAADSEYAHVVDGRFRGGWTTRHHGRPDTGQHAIQMELAMRGYMDEPDDPGAGNWPTPFDAERAAPLVRRLEPIIDACLAFARNL